MSVFVWEFMHTGCGCPGNPEKGVRSLNWTYRLWTAEQGYWELNSVSATAVCNCSFGCLLWNLNHNIFYWIWWIEFESPSHLKPSDESFMFLPSIVPSPKPWLSYHHPKPSLHPITVPQARSTEPHMSQMVKSKVPRKFSCKQFEKGLWRSQLFPHLPMMPPVSAPAL